MSIRSKLYIALSVVVLFALVGFFMVSSNKIESFSAIHFIKGIASGMTAIILATSFILLIKKVKRIGMNKIFYDSESILMLMVFSLSGSLILMLFEIEIVVLTIISALFAGLAGLLNGWYIRKIS